MTTAPSGKTLTELRTDMDQRMTRMDAALDLFVTQVRALMSSRGRADVVAAVITDLSSLSPGQLAGISAVAIARLASKEDPS